MQETLFFVFGELVGLDILTETKKANNKMKGSAEHQLYIVFSIINVFAKSPHKSVLFLFDLILNIPVNKCSVMSGWVFLG